MHYGVDITVLCLNIRIAMFENRCNKTIFRAIALANISLTRKEKLL